MNETALKTKMKWNENGNEFNQRQGKQSETKQSRAQQRIAFETFSNENNRNNNHLFKLRIPVVFYLTIHLAIHSRRINCQRSVNKDSNYFSCWFLFYYYSLSFLYFRLCEQWISKVWFSGKEMSNKTFDNITINNISVCKGSAQEIRIHEHYMLYVCLCGVVLFRWTQQDWRLLGTFARPLVCSPVKFMTFINVYVVRHCSWIYSTC